jgi:leucyl aminopeptidase
VTTFVYSTDAPVSIRADILALPMFEGPEPGPGVRDVKGADLVSLYRGARLKGKKGESLLVPNTGGLDVAAKAILLVGTGRRQEASPDAVRRALGRVASQLAGRRTVATTFPQVAGREAEDAVQASVEGILLGSYRFDRYKSGKDEDRPEKPALRDVTLLGSARWNGRVASRRIEEAIARGEVVSEAVAFTRDLVNTPAGDLAPADLADRAAEMAKGVRLEAKIWREAELERGRFGGILGVGRGSANPPRMIELRYRGAPAAQAPIALTGKGITFDSGGLSLKDAAQMEWMKCDMAGAASIMGTMMAIARLKPKVNVIAAIPSSENMPGGRAVHPGDVLRHRGGKTSEVLNTDAEGRLVLADALAYLAERKPRVIIDTATLTGACMIALGRDIYGVFGNDRTLVRDILAAGEAAGEPGWELPLYEDYREHIKSNVADVRNTGKDRWGGAITAALFLAEFVGDIPWAHLDIAGPAYPEKSGDYWPNGATGIPVRTLVQYVLTQAKRPARRSG